MKMAMLRVGEKCSKFATGDVYIFAAIVVAYLIYVVLAFAIAFWMARRCSKKVAFGKMRIWWLHASVAVLVTAGPVLPLVYYDVRAHLESVRWRKQIEQDRVQIAAWKNGLRFSPGSVRQDLDQAFATMPRRYLIQSGDDVFDAPPNTPSDIKGKYVSYIKGKIVEQLGPNEEWTKEDLDAFESMADSTDIGIAVLTAWARDRSNLSAVAAMCSEATLTRWQSQDCRQVLGQAVGAWCQAYGARCEELARDESFRKVVTGSGVMLRRP